MPNLLQLNKISKSYGPRVLFHEASFTLGERQKIGVVGRNGAGKSTLFNIILGEEKLKFGEGEVVVFEEANIGFIKQEVDFSDLDTVLGYLKEKTGREDWEIRKQASFFQLDEKKMGMKIKELSGGYQMRVKLTAMLLSEPNLILLDEPTNYLDLSTILLLEKFLQTYKGSSMIISHDREFLNNVCTETLEIEQGRFAHYPGKLDQYLAFKEQKLIEAKKYNKKQDNKIQHLQSFVDRFGSKATKAKQAQSKLKQIERISKIEIASPLKRVRIRMPELDVPKGLALRVNKMSIGYPGKTIAAGIEIDIEKGEHIAILGENGQGKTTFLRTLANDLQMQAGGMRWMPRMKIAYYAQHVVTNLNLKEKVGDYLERNAKGARTSEDILRMAGNFLFSEDDLTKSISMLSGGEKARLCLAGILLDDNNVLLLDEPTNHLDFETVEALAHALKETFATVLFISHNRGFINIVANSIIEVYDGSVKRFYGDYKAYIKKLENQAKVIDEPDTGLDAKEMKEARRAMREQEKVRKRELKKIEDKLEVKKARMETILKTFSDNPMKSHPDLSRELKQVEKYITELEDEWLRIAE